YLVFFPSPRSHRDLHSFPTRRSSDLQTINVTLNSVNGSTNLIIPMSILIADVNGNGAVNASDVSLTKSRIGQSITQTNSRSDVRSEEHTSELQSLAYLVCRLLLEKKK